uniref:Uncharacterized protein n=1 Tax=Ananas comosus var. bracteatus TaxID=296719 RepID=A0A6V7PAY6_ANACO|nr:unnamed protein product [Ananas comosus var. bracteatus]
MTFLFFSSSKTTTTAMATSSSKLPPVISILREALLLPAKTLPLFLPLLLFSLASSALLFSSTFLSISPLLSDLLHKAKSLAPPRPPIPADALPRLLADALVDVFAVARLHYGPSSPPSPPPSSSSSPPPTPSPWPTSAPPSPPDPRRPRRRSLLQGHGHAPLRPRPLHRLLLHRPPRRRHRLLPRRRRFPQNPNHLRPLSLRGIDLTLLLPVHAMVDEPGDLGRRGDVGIGALSWSVELFIGNKATGTALTLILMAVRLAIYGAFAALVASDPPTPPDQLMKVGAATAAAAAAWELYGVSVYTVFYYHCRRAMDWMSKW